MDATDILKKRLSTMRELRSLTGTMRDLSAVNVRQFENAAKAINEHAAVIELGFHALAINTEQYLSGEIAAPAANARIVILIGSDHGLCGRFNERLVSYATAYHFASTQAGGFSLAQLSNDDASIEQYPVHIVAVGELAARECATHGIPTDTILSLPGVVEGIPELVRTLLFDLEHWLQSHPEASVSVFHHRTTVSGMEPCHYQLIPVARRQTRGSRSWPSNKLPGITLAGPDLLVALIREHLFVSLYRACAESQAAEHASRFASMQAANRPLEL